MTLQQRLESLSTEMLQNCAKGLFASDKDGAGEALAATLAELEIRMGDEFAAWADENF